MASAARFAFAFSTIAALADGFHPLTNAPSTAALFGPARHRQRAPRPGRPLGIRPRRTGRDRDPGRQPAGQLLDQRLLGQPGAGQFLEQLPPLSFNVLVLGGVDSRVCLFGLVLLDAVLDHLVDGQVIAGDDFAEVPDPVRGDDVIPFGQAGFQQPVIAGTDRGGFLGFVEAVQQLPVVTEIVLCLGAGLDHPLNAAAVVMNRDRPGRGNLQVILQADPQVLFSAAMNW